MLVNFKHKRSIAFFFLSENKKSFYEISIPKRLQYIDQQFLMTVSYQAVETVARATENKENSCNLCDLHRTERLSPDAPHGAADPRREVQNLHVLALTSVHWRSESLHQVTKTRLVAWRCEPSWQTQMLDSDVLNFMGIRRNYMLCEKKKRKNSGFIIQYFIFF